MITLSSAIEQFIDERQAERLSRHTLDDYGYTYRRFANWIGYDPYVQSVSVDTIRGFLASTNDVSKKTTLNYHIGLSSLWHWMTEKNLVEQNVVRMVRPPRPEFREIIPYHRDEIKYMLEIATKGDLVARDQAIILMLLDTGIRATELCSLRMRDLSLSRRQILVYGKGSKERRLRFSIPTLEGLQIYLSSRMNSRFVFITEQLQPMNRHALRQMITRLGLRSGVPDANCHRFRHTFAIESLRNGMNIYALQKALGHTTLDMVKRYLALVQADLDEQMTRSSPVRAWRLGVKL